MLFRPTLALLGALWGYVDFASVHGQSPLGGMPMQLPPSPLQSNFGALGQGGLPQAPGLLQASGSSGLGGLLGGTPQTATPSGLPSGLGSIPQAAAPNGLGGSSGPGGMPSGLGSFGLPATPPGGSQAGIGGFGAPSSPLQSGPGAAGQGGLPTLNLLGGAVGQGGSSTPQHIQQMQAQAVQAATLDSMCPGKQRRDTNVGDQCWAMIWTAGGCKAENVPKYEEWHSMQSLEVLVGDVVQWANLPDERHKQGCYGDAGPPQNQPAPPMPSRGSSPLSGGLAQQGGMQAPLGLGAPAQGPAPPPEVQQKVMSALQSPDLASLCPGVGGSSTAVGEACWKNIWRHVGCLESSTPPYEDWHNSQSFEVLVADAAQWASLPSAKHKQTCYGSNVEL